MNKYLLRSAVTGALGGLLFGFDTAVIAGTTHALTGRFHLTPFELGFTVSIALWGTVLGAICVGGIGQRIGSREALRIMAALYLVSSLGCALAWSWQALLIARFIGGLGIGGSSVLGPVYIAELAPAKFRGRLVGLFQIGIVAGIMLAYASNFAISSLHWGALEWRWEFGVAAAPAAVFLAMLFGVPHSPRWLAAKGRIEEARRTLNAIGHAEPEAELQAIVASIHLVTAASKEPLFQRRYRKPILLAVAIAAFNQLSGINTIMYYANDIFASAGFSQLSSGLQAVAVGAVNLSFTLVAMALIDKVGRKALLLFGCAGMTVSLGGIAGIFIAGRWHGALIFFVGSFTAFFAVSSGAVVWVYISEIFPTQVRVRGQSLGCAVIWVMNGVISQIFPVVAAKSAALPFATFAAMMALQFAVTLMFFPETKGLSLEELQRKMCLTDG